MLLRPLGIGEILDAAFRLFRREFKTLAACVLLATIPIAIIQTLIEASTAENTFNPTEETVIDDWATYGAGLLVSAILSFIATSFATAACFRAISKAYLGGHATAGESLAFGRRHFLRLTVASIAYSIAIVLGLIALLVGSIWVAVACTLYATALLYERLGPIKSLRRSIQLVSGRWWPTLGTVVLMTLLTAIVQGVMTALLLGVVFASSENELLVAIMYTLVAILGYALTLPFQAAVFTLLYFDLRVRKEGFDLQLLAEHVGVDEVSPEAVALSTGLGGAAPPGMFIRPGAQAPPPPAPPPGGFAPPVPPTLPRDEPPAPGSPPG